MHQRTKWHSNQGVDDKGNRKGGSLKNASKDEIAQ